jgi:hypothetical protein
MILTNFTRSVIRVDAWSPYEHKAEPVKAGPKAGSVNVVIRAPGRAPFRAVSLDDLTNIIRIKRQAMAMTREELKALRLKAMGVVGNQMQKSADMFQRVVDYGSKVDAARAAAETAQVAELDNQIADLKQMEDDLVQFGNSASPTVGASAGSTSSPAPAAPVATTVPPASASAALQALQAAQPSPTNEAWAKGDAYIGTHGETLKPASGG